MIKKHDAIYASALDEIIDFRFDEKVVNVFPDMIQRSVPAYASLISAIGVLAGRYAQEDSHCYDLGSSLGAVTLAMRQRVNVTNCDIIAVDSSQEMVKKGLALIQADTVSTVPVEMLCADILDIKVEQESVVVMNYTLQFIPVAQRLDLIKKIYQGLKPGGALILSEKLAFDDAKEQDFYTEAHHDFKRANGYSDLEISQKRTALDNVLIPETLICHQKRLSDAGFDFSTQWFQCFNFASMIAIK